MSDDSKIKESAKRHFNEALEMAKSFARDLQVFDRKFFDFRIAFVGFLGVILTIVFANTIAFSCFFQSTVVIVFIISFFFLLHEIWIEGIEKMRNLNIQERKLILHNILNSAVQRNKREYAEQVVKILEVENKIIQAMNANRSIDEIVSSIIRERKWNWGFFVWSLLALSVPIMFLVELFSR